MTCATLLTALNILVAFIGVLFVALAVSEYTRLKALRVDLGAFKEKWHADQARFQKAQQRVLASYQTPDLDRRVALLRSAIETDPATFNGYNALGYAYLEKGDGDAAQEAFLTAIATHPEMKEGYFDLARLYRDRGKPELARIWLQRAVSVDPSSKRDIEADPNLAGLAENRE